MKKANVLIALCAFLFSTVAVFAQSNLAAQYRSGMLPMFLEYVQIGSMSDYKAEWMTPGQKKMAKRLYQDIVPFGFPTYFSEDKYIYVNIPSNLTSRQAPRLGLSVHYDTTPDIIGENIHPQVIKNYNGKPIHLKHNNVVIDPNDPDNTANAYLKRLIGQTIVTADGTTNLGADDKAGVVIMMTLIKTLAENPQLPHGDIDIVFTPNEDVGRSAERLDINYYKPDYAFDFDASVDGEVIVGNFSADRIVIRAQAVPGHQSYAAENGYRNAVDPIAFITAYTARPHNLPNRSTGKQGYIEPRHDLEQEASSDYVAFHYRYFNQRDGKRWHRRLDRAIKIAEKMFDVKITKEVTKQYENVKCGVKPEIKQIAQAAMDAAGVTPRYVEERAGTTIAMMMAKYGFGGYTFFTGQVNPHKDQEWLSEYDMFKAYEVALNLVHEVAQMKVQPTK